MPEIVAVRGKDMLQSPYGAIPVATQDTSRAPAQVTYHVAIPLRGYSSCNLEIGFDEAKRRIEGCNPLTGLFQLQPNMLKHARYQRPGMLQSPYGAIPVATRAELDGNQPADLACCNPLTGLFQLQRKA